MALNDVFVPLLAKQFPEILDFYLPPEGCSYRLAVVRMRKQYPGHAKRVMFGVWSYLRQFMYTKFIIVCDDDVDVRDWKEVIWALTTRVDPARDSVVVENTPIDYLDFASPVSGLGSKIGIDETNSGITGLRHAACSRSARWWALMRSTRERPEPFSSTSSGAWIFLAATHSRITRALSSARAGGPPSSAPSVRKSWRAM